MIRTSVRWLVGTLARLLPPSAPEFIYTNLLPGPLRGLFNRFVVLLLPKTIHLPEGDIVLNPEDPVISGSLAFGVYEPYELELFRKETSVGVTVIDIGANIGLYSTIAAHRVGHTGRVIAFEPEPHNYALLQQTIHKNNFTTISAFPMAVADTPGTLTLNVFDSNKGKHSLVKDNADDKGFSKTIKVETVVLDTFLAAKGGIQADIIKMDIEGAESLALRGMSEALSHCKVLFFEFTPTSIKKVGDDPTTILTTLKSYGFTLFVIDEHTKTTQEIKDLEHFVHTIPTARAANLLCKK